MTILAAVNEMLEWIGQPPVTSYTAGDEAGEAETTLLRVNSEVQEERSWAPCQVNNFELELATIKIAASAGSGTFSWREAISEGVTGAIGNFSYEEGGYVYLIPYSGTFTGGHTITGASSGATRTGAAYTTVTTGKHSIGTQYVSVQPSISGCESAKFAIRDGFLWDLENATSTWSVNVSIDAIQVLGFITLPTKLARYITKAAAHQFFQYKTRRDPTPTRTTELTRSRVHALQEDGDLRRTNLLQTPDSLAVKGNRYTYPRNIQ